MARYLSIRPARHRCASVQRSLNILISIVSYSDTNTGWRVHVTPHYPARSALGGISMREV